MRTDNKSPFKHFFKSNLSSSNGDDDKSYRSILKKRDTHNSSTSSIENILSAGSNRSDRSGSHLSLKRFFKKLKPEEHKEKEKRHHHFLSYHSGSELYRKYTKGKLIGSGASGSVNLVNLKTDPTKVFAVKKFRTKLPQELDLDYNTKVNNEFKIGQKLQHENLIHTIELIKEVNGVFSSIEYFIIMEYCEYDFFNLVMSGLMTSEEIDCYLKQIICGVNHLHSNGLAHRDLKLDNCVVNEFGILKLIDFGSAAQFRKPSTLSSIDDDTNNNLIRDNDKVYELVFSRGVVGSDPYLAPEVLDVDSKYDARKVDVWSIAIIYACMVLRRFPWKLPRVSDPSYKLFLNNNIKLFKLLPESSREFISHLLKPKDERYTMDEVINHNFIKNIKYCTTETQVHIHNLVTEEQLEQINQEREVLKKLQNSGIA